MCEKCKELKEKFHAAESICERQTRYNEYDKQRKKCAKELGSLAPAPPAPAVIKKERKPRKKKETKTETDDAPTPAPTKKPAPKKPVADSKTSVCKHYYRGVLCANSQMDKPFCPCDGDLDKCPVKK